VQGEREEKRILDFLDAALAVEGSYLGFITKRPLRNAPVGASIIAANGQAGVTVLDRFAVHIAGNEFFVDGTPFLQQDNAVGACAQASIWMALRSVRKRHGNAAYSPAQLTNLASRYLPPTGPCAGRQGLNLIQMLEAIRSSGHSPLQISLPLPPPPVPPAAPIARDAIVVFDSIGPYLDSGIPVILALIPPSLEGHAVVAIGRDNGAAASHKLEKKGVAGNPYLPASNWLTSITVHNDNTGPYLPLKGGVAGAPYSLDHVIEAIAVLPDVVFTTAAEFEVLSSMALTSISALYSIFLGQPKLPTLKYVARPILCTRHAFRLWAKNETALDPLVRERYRTHELSKYLWVLELHDGAAFDPTNPNAASKLGEIVWDASADPLHGDGLLFARVSDALWPGDKFPVPGLLASQATKEDWQLISVPTAAPTRAISKPWLG
jgi:hypothetical protein